MLVGKFQQLSLNATHQQTRLLLWVILQIQGRGYFRSTSWTLHLYSQVLLLTNCSNWPVLGIEVDWGEIQKTPEPAVFALGIVRDPVVQYKLPNETIQMRSHYYRSSFDSDIDAVRLILCSVWLELTISIVCVDKLLFRRFRTSAAGCCKLW